MRKALSGGESPTFREARKHGQNAFPIKQIKFYIGDVMQDKNLPTEIVAGLQLFHEIRYQPAPSSDENEVGDVGATGFEHHLPNAEEVRRILPHFDGADTEHVILLEDSGDRTRNLHLAAGVAEKLVAQRYELHG